MKCPGQDTRYWKPGAVFEAKCPKCGHEVEFFKDDTTRRCRACGHRFLNPAMDFGCAAYCQYAEQCIGDLPPELLAQRQNLLKDRVAVEMKRRFKKDFKRIGHALRVARHAEQIGREEQGNLAAILVAAYLHDIGLSVTEKGASKGAAWDQEDEGPALAREILTRLGAGEGLIEEVCHIIGRHRAPGPEEGLAFRCVHDAEAIADLEERQKADPLSRDSVSQANETAFLTESGRRLARRVLSPAGP